MEGNNPLKLVLFLLDVGWWYSLVPDESCVCWSVICTSWYYKIWRSFGYFIIIVVIVKTIDFTAYYLYLFHSWSFVFLCCCRYIRLQIYWIGTIWSSTTGRQGTFKLLTWEGLPVITILVMGLSQHTMSTWSLQWVISSCVDCFLWVKSSNTLVSGKMRQWNWRNFWIASRFLWKRAWRNPVQRSTFCCKHIFPGWNWKAFLLVLIWSTSDR